MVQPFLSYSDTSPLARADSDALVQRYDENFSVSRFAALCTFCNGVYRRFDKIVIDRYFETDFSQQITGFPKASVNFGNALLPAVAEDFVYCYKVYLRLVKLFFYLFESVRLNYSNNKFHNKSPLNLEYQSYETAEYETAGYIFANCVPGVASEAVVA
jgi:hypothetical protein